MGLTNCRGFLATLKTAPVFVSSSSAFRTSAGTSLVVNYPAGIAVGDQLWMIATIGITPGGITTPSGWTLIVDASGFTSARLGIFQRTVNGGEGPTLTLNWASAPANQFAAIGMVAIRGAKATHNALSIGAALSASPWVVPGATTTQAPTLRLDMMATEAPATGTAASWTPASGMTERVDDGYTAGYSVGIYSGEEPAAGVIGSKSYPASPGGKDGRAWSVFLEAA